MKNTLSAVICFKDLWFFSRIHFNLRRLTPCGQNNSSVVKWQKTHFDTGDKLKYTSFLG